MFTQNHVHDISKTNMGVTLNKYISSIFYYFFIRFPHPKYILLVVLS